MALATLRLGPYAAAPARANRYAAAPLLGALSGFGGGLTVTLG